MADSIVYQPGDRAVKHNFIEELERERARLEQAFSDIEDWARANDVQMKFERSQYDGVAGGDPVVVKIFVADGDGTPNPFSQVAGVTVEKTGGAIITESMPVVFERSRDGEGKLRFEVSIHVNNAVAETVALSLVDTEGSGLDVSDTAEVVFS